MNQLVNEGLVQVGDAIEFKTKNCVFRATVGLGGHIQNTTVLKDSVPISKHSIQRVVFSSLTAWSSACVQLVTKKNHTRYASWKRVHHVRTGMTLASIRRTLKVMVRKTKASRKSLYAELNRLHGIIQSGKRTAYKKDMDLRQLDQMLTANSDGRDLRSILRRLKRKASSRKSPSIQMSSTGSSSCAPKKACLQLVTAAGSTSGAALKLKTTKSGAAWRDI